MFRLTVHQDSVTRLNQDIIQRIACKRVAQVDAEDARRPVRLPAEKLCRIKPCIRCHTSSLVDRVTQMLLTRRAIPPWGANLAGDEHFGIRLKVIPPEDAHRIERLQLRCRFGMFKSGC